MSEMWRWPLQWVGVLGVPIGVNSYTPQFLWLRLQPADQKVEDAFALVVSQQSTRVYSCIRLSELEVISKTKGPTSSFPDGETEAQKEVTCPRSANKLVAGQDLELRFLNSRASL